eukprot:96108_1
MKFEPAQFDVLFDNEDIIQYEFMHALLIIRHCCIIKSDEKYRRSIVQNKYFEYLLQMLLECMVKYKNFLQLYHLGMSIVLKAMDIYVILLLVDQYQRYFLSQCNRDSKIFEIYCNQLDVYRMEQKIC